MAFLPLQRAFRQLGFYFFSCHSVCLSRLSRSFSFWSSSAVSIDDLVWVYIFEGGYLAYIVPVVGRFIYGDEVLAIFTHKYDAIHVTPSTYKPVVLSYDHSRVIVWLVAGY